ncbi:MAG: PAS domain-containing protein [Rhodobacteraceae bacterium]|nr:PAS domain-containing protein [Paracoccaceae bacterium]
MTSANTHQLPTGTDEQILAFWSYWHALPRHGPLPRLSDYLDGVPAYLQPTVVIVDVYSPARFEFRLCGTRLVDLIDREVTGQDVNAVYSGPTQQLAAEVAWRAANQPCGYLSERTVRSFTGVLVTFPGITLPVLTNNADRKTLVNFSNLDQVNIKLGRHDHIDVIQGFELTSWIDIGAGIPKD